MYTKLVYRLRMKGMYKDRTLRNVHGRNITKVRLFELCAKYLQIVTVQVYTKPVYCTSVHKTSSLCKCTQNQFTVQVYTKPVYWLIVKRMYMDRTILRNVKGRNITKVKE